MLSTALKITGPIVCALTFICSISWATDYSPMSTDELSQIRGTLYNASDEERNAFRSEWQERLELMSLEDRQKYAGSSQGNGNGPGDGTSPGNGLSGRTGNNNQDETNPGIGGGNRQGKGSGGNNAGGRGRK